MALVGVASVIGLLGQPLLEKIVDHFLENLRSQRTITASSTIGLVALTRKCNESESRGIPAGSTIVRRTSGSLVCARSGYCYRIWHHDSATSCCLDRPDRA
ncbi:hypothetical protein [uncultured Paraburkholderia sp.]|uniref:hypothetical protein n=1 Tax=uncultured Paraburkholderia sp. TaxID=1822466 RepID=UPI002598101F|nr:hypothetical protein [uncultured Paraburkholderia sp.]